MLNGVLKVAAMKTYWIVCHEKLLKIPCLIGINLMWLCEVMKWLCMHCPTLVYATELWWFWVETTWSRLGHQLSMMIPDAHKFGKDSKKERQKEFPIKFRAKRDRNRLKTSKRWSSTWWWLHSSGKYVRTRGWIQIIRTGQKSHY